MRQVSLCPVCVRPACECPWLVNHVLPRGAEIHSMRKHGSGHDMIAYIIDSCPLYERAAEQEEI